MIRSCSCLVLAAVIQVIVGLEEEAVFDSGSVPSPNSQNEHKPPNIPEYCQFPPPGINVHKCCPIPTLFSDEEMERCGIFKNQVNNLGGRTKFRVPCEESICLMENGNMLHANRSIDYENLRTFVDNWAGANPEFSAAIYEAKKICAKDGGPSGPPVCEHDRIFFCLTSHVLWNCNLRSDPAGECLILKEHMDECRPYYQKKNQQSEENVQNS